MTELLDLQKMDAVASFKGDGVSPFGSCVFNSCNKPVPTGT